MHPTIYAKYPILEKIGYFKAVNIKKKVQDMEKKKGNTVTIAESNPAYASDKEESNDKKVPVWRTKGKVTPIPEMDDAFLRKAFFHSLKKIGHHSANLQKAERSLNTFMELNGHLAKEAAKRGLDWIETMVQNQEEEKEEA